MNKERLIHIFENEDEFLNALSFENRPKDFFSQLGVTKEFLNKLVKENKLSEQQALNPTVFDLKISGLSLSCFNCYDIVDCYKCFDCETCISCSFCDKIKKFYNQYERNYSLERNENKEYIINEHLIINGKIIHSIDHYWND